MICSGMVLAVAVMSSELCPSICVDLLSESDAASTSNVIRVRLSSRRFVSLNKRIADEQNLCVNQMGALTATILKVYQKAPN